jgi:hypothetical protein
MGLTWSRVVDIDLISGYIIVSRLLGVSIISVERWSVPIIRAIIDVLITPNVGELAARYINVSGVLKKRHSGLESTVVNVVEVVCYQVAE